MKKKAISYQLILSPFISQCGTAIYLLGLNWFIVHATGDTKLIGWITGLGGVCFVLGDFLAATIVDHHDRKLVMLGCDGVSAAACIAAALLLNPVHMQTWLLIALTGILDLTMSISYPAAKAITPDVIKSAALQRFNAIANTVFSMANIFSPLIGGALLSYRVLNFQGFLLVNALSFVLAGLLIWSIRAPRFVSTEDSNMLRDTVSGLQFMFSKRSFVEMMAALGAFNFCAAGFLLTAPFIADTSFHGNVGAYSEFLMLSAVGGLIGGTLLSLQPRSVSAQQVYTEQMIYGALLLALGFNLSHWFWLIAAFCSGFVNGRMFASLATIMQEATPREMLGRVFGLIFLIYDGVQPLGNFFFGNFIHAWGAHTYTVLGVILLLCFGLLIVSLRRRNRQAQSPS